MKGIVALHQPRVDFQPLLANACRQVELGEYETADALLTQAREVLHSAQAGTGPALQGATWQQLRHVYCDALREIGSQLEERRDYAQALVYARELEHHDPRAEALVRRLIHLFVLSESRGRALAALERRLMLVGEGQGGLFLISGVAGIGKTSLALVAQNWARANDTAFVLTRAYERGMPPFLLWQDVLAGLSQVTGSDLAALPEPFGRAAPAESAHLLARAIGAWLHDAAARQPLVLLLDDLHWADPDSLDLLEMISRHLEQTGQLIIITYRADVLDRDHPLAQLLPTLLRNRPLEVIELAPLDLAGTRHLVDAWLGPCSTALAHYLHRRAEGHPLFLVELLTDLTRKNLLIQDNSGRWLPPAGDAPIPAMLQQLIAQRVAQLGQQAETLLATAAVIGESWRLPTVEALLGWPEAAALDVLQNALAARILVVDEEREERYRFSHGLIREVLYSQQLARRRKRLHAQIADHLEQQGLSDPAPLADHFFEAGRWDKAYRYSEEAGRTARQRFAFRSALRFYDQALQSLQAADVTDASAQLMSLYEQIGELHNLLNQRLQAADAYGQMVEVARLADDRQAQGRAMFLRAVSLERSYQREEAAVVREAALQLAREIEDPRLLALNYYAFGFNYAVTGQPELSRLYLEQAEGYARLLDDADILADILRACGIGETWGARYGIAHDSLAEARSWAERSQNSYSKISLYTWTGLAQLEAGHYQEARAILSEGLTSAAGLDESHLLQLRTLNVLAYLYRELGDLEQAHRISQQAVAAGKQRESDDNIEATCYALLELATTCIHEGDAAAAIPYIREFEALSVRPTEYARFKYMNRFRLLQTELALAHREFKEALAQCTPGRETAQAVELHKNVVKWRLYEGRALAGLGRADEALEPLRQAVTLADEIGHGSLRWQTRLRLAQVQTALGDQAAAETYQEALSLVAAIADELTDPQLRATFLNSPLVTELHTAATASPPVATEPASESAAGLTPREIEVIGLIARGMTNQQIAEALTISVRTVNTHVTNILNKTGCDNRTAAAAFAMQHGLA